jgi:hypothetical protein
MRASAPIQDATEWITHTERLMRSDSDWYAAKHAAQLVARSRLHATDISQLEEYLEQVAHR